MHRSVFAFVFLQLVLFGATDHYLLFELVYGNVRMHAYVTLFARRPTMRMRTCITRTGLAVMGFRVPL